MDRIDSALATVLPLVPGLAYFRFCCEDPRCGIELDEIDPEQWALLEVTVRTWSMKDAYSRNTCARLSSVTTLASRLSVPISELGASL